jgi:hypothetical protein
LIIEPTAIYIFYSSECGDPMLLDSAQGFHNLAQELRMMAAGAPLDVAFATKTSRSPEPYTELLPGIRIRRLNVGRTECNFAEDRWLELRASKADLEKLCLNLERLRNGDHTHLYSTPLSLVFEVDDVQC